MSHDFKPPQTGVAGRPSCGLRRDPRSYTPMWLAQDGSGSIHVDGGGGSRVHGTISPSLLSSHQKSSQLASLGRLVIVLKKAECPTRQRQLSGRKSNHSLNSRTLAATSCSAFLKERGGQNSSGSSSKPCHCAMCGCLAKSPALGVPTSDGKIVRSHIKWQSRFGVG